MLEENGLTLYLIKKRNYPQMGIRLGRFRGKDRLADFVDNRQYKGGIRAASYILIIQNKQLTIKMRPHVVHS